MQQRLWSYSYSSRVVPEDHAAAAMGGAAPRPPQLKHHQHASRTDADRLPVYYDHRSGVENKEGCSRPRPAEKWVHAIPLIVVFCFLVLWWSSVSVKVVSFEGRIAVVRETEMPLPLTLSRVNIAILAAMPPTFLVPQNLTVHNATEVPTGDKK